MSTRSHEARPSVSACRQFACWPVHAGHALRRGTMARAAQLEARTVCATATRTVRRHSNARRRSKTSTAARKQHRSRLCRDALPANAANLARSARLRRHRTGAVQSDYSIALIDAHPMTSGACGPARVNPWVRGRRAGIRRGGDSLRAHAGHPARRPRCQDELEATKVVVFSTSAAIEHAVIALDAGASGYILKTSSAEDIVHGLRAVHSGEVFITHGFATKVMLALRNASIRKMAADAIRLNVREQQIIKLLLSGRTNKEIAQTSAHRRGDGQTLHDPADAENKRQEPCRSRHRSAETGSADAAVRSWALDQKHPAGIPIYIHMRRYCEEVWTPNFARTSLVSGSRRRRAYANS